MGLSPIYDPHIWTSQRFWCGDSIWHLGAAIGIFGMFVHGVTVESGRCTVTGLFHGDSCRKGRPPVIFLGIVSPIENMYTYIYIYFRHYRSEFVMLRTATNRWKPWTLGNPAFEKLQIINCDWHVAKGTIFFQFAGFLRFASSSSKTSPYPYLQTTTTTNPHG